MNRVAKSEQKNKIVRNIFLNVSKVDSGAKGKGQVMIVGHSEDTQKQMNITPRDNSKASKYAKKHIHEITSIPIVCKIDLSRLSRIPYERNSRLNNNTKSPPAVDFFIMVTSSW